ncbi:UNVERIFIED_CONTAM: hypothetical protein Sangu_2871000 [Sesamum angustifolium]|uniref:DUF8040 domain-containing protein n=1 Tax=Sesamum angustifolium TaxID=2727405 RepID=A0AAW2IN05_9LAMI
MIVDASCFNSSPTLCVFFPLFHPESWRLLVRCSQHKLLDWQPEDTLTPGSNEFDIPEEFYAFRDLICPELFRENVPRNTSALQGKGWVVEIMAILHTGRFYDNICMTKLCFYALADALIYRGLLSHGQTSTVSSIKKVSLFLETIGSAVDARFLNHVVSQDPAFPFPPIGKYYLVDVGFTNYQCFLAPYRVGDVELSSSAPSGFSYRLLYTSQLQS